MNSLLNRIEKLESVLPQVGEDKIIFVSFVGNDSEECVLSATCDGRTFARDEETVDEFRARIDQETRRTAPSINCRIALFFNESASASAECV